MAFNTIPTTTTAPTSTESGGSEFLGDLFGLLGLGAGIAGGGAAVASGMDRLQQIGQQAVLGADVNGQRIPGSAELAQQAIEMSQFQPFTVTTATGSQFGFRPAPIPSYSLPYSPPSMFPSDVAPIPPGLPPIPPGVQPGQPAPGFVPSKKPQQVDPFAGTPFAGTGGPRPPILQTDGMAGPEYIETGIGPGSAAQLSLSPNEQFIQNMLMGQAEQGLFEGPYGELQRQQAAQQAFGLGGQFMGAAGAQPADVLKLRQQYGGLAGQAAQGLLDPMATREADVYERIRATQRPEEERQRLALEERLAQQGRLGVRTSMFGGTPEQLALSKAQEEAQDRASLAAMQQAQAEQRQALSTAQALGGMFGQQAQLGSALQAQQAGLGAQYAGLGSQLAMQDLAAQQAQQQLALGALTGAYLPQQQLLAAQQASQLFPQLQQRGQLFGAGQFGETSMAGLEAMLVAEQAAANLLGGIGSNVLSGLFSPVRTDSGVGSLFGSVLGGIFGDDN